MKSNSPSSARRWKFLAFQVAISLATFGAGWYVATEVYHASAAPAKSTTATSKATAIKYTLADLTKALKITGNYRREHALLDLVSGLNADEVKSMLDDITAKPVTEDNQAALNSLIERWSELDPKAALAWTQNVKDQQTKNSSMRQVLADWSAQDPAAALAALRALPAGLQSAGIGYNPYQPTSTLYSDVFGAWAKNDPTSAAASALSLPSSASRDQSVIAVASAWAMQDPTGALAWANSLPTGTAKNDAVNAAIQAMSNQDPQSAANLASALPGTKDRDSLLENIARTWAVQDPIAALTWANQSLTGAAQQGALNNALNQYAASDPAGAAAYLPQLSGNLTNNNDMDLFMIAFSWSEQDSPAALNWALSLPTSPDGSQDANSNLREETLFNVLYNTSKSDPASAAAFIQQNLTASDPDFNRLAPTIARSWADSDPQAALAWAQSLPAGDAQNTTISSVLVSLSQVDPQTALTDAQQLTGTNRDQTVSSVIAGWAMQQPDQAAAALDDLPPGKDLDAATTGVARSWLSQDPNAASQWIDTLPAGAARDGAVGAIISNIGSDDPGSAFNWAVTIGNAQTRDTQVVSLATKWSAKDPASAAAAAQNALTLSGLTNAQVTSLQKIVAKGAAP